MLTTRKRSKLTNSYRRSCARRFNQKLRSILHVTRTECCESIFLRWPEVTGKRYCRLNFKKCTSRGHKLRQHGRGQNGKSGNCSDNTVTWSIHSQQIWHVRCDTQERDVKQYGVS